MSSTEHLEVSKPWRLCLSVVDLVDIVLVVIVDLLKRLSGPLAEASFVPTPEVCSLLVVSPGDRFPDVASWSSGSGPLGGPRHWSCRSWPLSSSVTTRKS